MDIWIVIIEDHHADVDAYPFSTEAAATGYARTSAQRLAWHPASIDWDAELTPGMRQEGWVLYVPYSGEGDCVRVMRRAVDSPPRWGS